MARIISCYEAWACAKCAKVGAKLKVAGRGGADIPHSKRRRNRVMRRLAAEGWKFQAVRWDNWREGLRRRKGVRSWCPKCCSKVSLQSPKDGQSADMIVKAMKLFGALAPPVTPDASKV